MIIAGDGYAYALYVAYEPIRQPNGDYYYRAHLMVLRVGPDGTYSNMELKSWTHPEGFRGWYGGLISNGDQGVVVTWDVVEEGSDPFNYALDTHNFGMGLASGSGATVVNDNGPLVSGQKSAVLPVLQAQDGSFVGKVFTDGLAMVSFDAAGAIRWVVPNDEPAIATEDGGVIGKSGIIYNENGAAAGKMGDGSTFTYSWLGYTYRTGSVHQFISPVIDFASVFGAFQLGNPSGNAAAASLTQSHVYLPFEIADTTQGPPQTAAFATQMQKRYKATSIAFNALPFGKATAEGFLQSLKTTNRIVAYVGHIYSLSAMLPFKAGGLCFAGSNCLMAGPLVGQQVPAQGISWSILPNGFSPQSKIVVLGACGIENDFIGQWHLKAGGQALIVPVYQNQDKSISLTDAAEDLQFLLDQFDGGKNVGQAVDILNNVNASANPPKPYSWTVVPQAGRNVTAKK